MQPTALLIVHPYPAQLESFVAFLQHRHYQVRFAGDNRQALQMLYTQRPAGVLLDSEAQNSCAFELGRCLKDEPELLALPLIFMGRGGAGERQAFAAGAVDYLRSPWAHEDALARIQVHIANARLQQEYLQRNTVLRAQNVELLKQGESLRRQNIDLDAFAHTVAHELKNALHGLHDNAGLLEQAYHEQIGGEGRDSFARMGRQVMKMSDIIDSLLLLAGTSRSQKMSVDRIHMEMILEKVWDRLAETLEFYRPEIITPAQWPTAVGHPAWIEEIWVNYISNALKYGGTPPRIELGAEVRKKWVRFWVKDNGPGLTGEQKACLFKPFTRLHRERAEGHGLGLSIVKNMAHKLGGKAGVKSRPGNGSRFYFMLPAELPRTQGMLMDEDDFIFERIIQQSALLN